MIADIAAAVSESRRVEAIGAARGWSWLETQYVMEAIAEYAKRTPLSWADAVDRVMRDCDRQFCLVSGLS